MGKNFIQPCRMESQFVDTKLFSVVVEDDAKALDGEFVVLGDFIADTVYSAAYTRAGQSTLAPKGMTVREVSKADTASQTGVCVIDIAETSTITGNGNTYRMGVKTIGLEAEANRPVRARKLVVDDTFLIGEDNIDGTLTVDKFAVISTTTGKAGKLKSADAEDTDGGFSCKVIDKITITQGVDATTAGNGVQAYRLLVVQN